MGRPGPGPACDVNRPAHMGAGSACCSSVLPYIQCPAEGAAGPAAHAACTALLAPQAREAAAGGAQAPAAGRPAPGAAPQPPTWPRSRSRCDRSAAIPGASPAHRLSRLNSCAGAEGWEEERGTMRMKGDHSARSTLPRHPTVRRPTHSFSHPALPPLPTTHLQQHRQEELAQQEEGQQRQQHQPQHRGNGLQGEAAWVSGWMSGERVHMWAGSCPAGQWQCRAACGAGGCPACDVRPQHGSPAG